MIPYRLWPENVEIYTAGQTRAVAAGISNQVVGNRAKEVKVETADWTGPVTDYDNAASYGNASAYRADVAHAMGTPRAVPVAMHTHDGYIRRILIDPLSIDEDTTRIWILADQAPPYDIIVTFVAG